MKLRIRGSSVRLRLTQDEVARIAAGQSVSESSVFPGGQFRYQLSVSSTAAIAADFSDGTMVVELPRRMAADWASGDDVSLYGEQAVDGEKLTILVEKDFACLSPGGHRESADDAGAFPHPDADSGKGC